MHSVVNRYKFSQEMFSTIKVNLKALCQVIRPNCFLVNSLVRDRKYGYAQYHGIVHGSTGMRMSNACCAKTFAMVELTSLQSSLMGKPNSKNADK